MDRQGCDRVYPLSPLDIHFDRVPVQCYGSQGTPYTRWIPHGMPKLGQYQYLLDIVCFLYPDRASAIAGEDAGGTGFFVTVVSETYPDLYHHLYAVTNRHVACGSQGKPPCSTIRVNKHSGPPEIFEFDPAEWMFIPKQHDVAVIKLRLNTKVHKVEAIDVGSFFLTDQNIKEFEINAADDVFMLGRFIDYDGLEANLPSMRFGNISMMEVDVPPPNCCTGKSLVVDMHSRTGFSGSPVFVYRTAGSIFGKPDTIMGGGHMMKLLGILWGQFPEEWDVKDKKQVALGQNQTIEGWSGMSLVAPASAIREVLDMPKFKKRRQEIDESLHKKYAGAPVAQSAPSTKVDNPSHKEDFNRLLGAAVRKP